MNLRPTPFPAPTPVPGGRPGFTPSGGGMDVSRSPQIAKRRQRRRWLLAGGAVLTLAAVGVVFARLRPAMPTVERVGVSIDTVRRGPMIRQVRGLGTLVPEEIRWIAARTDARVERIVIFPGATVEPQTVILVLSSPELEQSVLDGDAAVTAAEAKLVNLRAQLEGTALERQSAFAKAQGDRDTAIAQVEVNEKLAEKGLIAEVELKKSRISAKELTDCCEIEGRRVNFTRQSIDPQLAVAQGELDGAKAQAALRHGQLDALQVRAGMTGVLQLVPVEVGQRITAGTNVARVADPARLKAQVKIPETQARDIQPGQPADVDTRNGVATGRVARVDPSVQAGTVLVDITFGDGPLPRGARPDLSVEGTIELEHIDDTLVVGRPAFGQEEGTVSVYRLTPDGTEAARVKVKLGRGSLSTVEVRDGLQAGDKIILSDTSNSDKNSDVIRLD